MKRILVISMILYAFSAYGAVEPDDPYYDKQWGLKAVHAPSVWGLTTGSSNVYAAVMDTGIDAGHEDLKDNIDADHSKSFMGAASYEDGQGHGTHVAGIIGARGNNHLGVSGMAWNVRLIALRVLDDDGNILDRKRSGIVSEALRYVKFLLEANPAMKIVINMSLGWYDTTPPIRASTSSDEVWTAMHELDMTGRALICISSGNNGIDISSPAPSTMTGDKVPEGTYQYPAAYKNLNNVIVAAAVSNSPEDYSVLQNSNYSANEVHIASPGDNIYSTLSIKHNSSYESKAGFTAGASGCYVSTQGTSQASPYVAGTAVLLMSAYPGKSISEIRRAILDGANSYYAADKTIYGLLDVKGAFDVMAGKTVKPGVPIDDIHFPDEAFREYLLSEIDINGDSRLNEDETAAVKEINISGLKVSSLKGIAYFKELRELDCSRTEVERLDFSPYDEGSLGTLPELRIFRCTDSPKLEYLNFGGGQLSEVSITGCPRLQTFKCPVNEVKYLDLRGLTALSDIDCEENMLAAVDLPSGYSGKVNLSGQDANTAQITETGANQWEIDISKIMPSDSINNISGLRFSHNELHGEFIADIGYTYTLNKSAGLISAGSSLIADGQAKELSRPASMAYEYKTGSDYTLSVVMSLSEHVDEEPEEPEEQINPTLEVNAVNFPDNNFLAYVKRYDTDNDGHFSDSEIRAVSSLSVPSRGIQSLRGAELFTSVISLDCRNNSITDLNAIVMLMTKLRSLECDDNKLVNLTLTAHPALEYVSCRMTTLKSINLNGCRNLKTLRARKSSTEINYAAGTTTTTYKDAVTHINIGGTLLEDLVWDNGRLEALDASGCSALKRIQCSSNALSSLNVTGCLSLENLFCRNNSINALDLTGLTSLKQVNCNDNGITSLKLGGCRNLTSLNCTKNALTSLELSDLPSLSVLTCNNNPITELDITGLSSIEEVNCIGCNISVIKAAGSETLKRLECSNTPLTDLDLSNCRLLESLKVTSSLRRLNITDCEALSYLSGFGSDISEVTAVNCRRLTSLSLGGSMTTLDVKGCTSLDTLSCIDSNLESLDITGCVSLKYLYCEGNKLTSLNLSGLPSLVKVTCGRNDFTVLDVRDCPSLYNLDCSESGLTAINITGCPKLRSIYCDSNDLTELDVSSCVSLETLYCACNHIAYIDLTPPAYHVRLYGQELNGQELTETGNSLWPYSFNFREIMPSDRIENIAGWPFWYEVNGVRAEIKAYDSGGSAISMNYADGTAYFSERPSSMTYGYNAQGNRMLNGTIYFTGSQSPNAPSETDTGKEGSPSSGSTTNPEPAVNDGTGNIQALLGIDEGVSVYELSGQNAYIGPERQSGAVKPSTGERLLVLLPEMLVYADGVYIMPISFDSPAHRGEYLTWHSNYGELSSSALKAECIFLAEDGTELVMPLRQETEYVKAAVYLEAGRTYSPAVTSNSASIADTGESKGGGGCEAVSSILALLILAIKRRA